MLRVFVEKLLIAQLAMKFFTSYGTQRFISARNMTGKCVYGYANLLYYKQRSLLL